MRRRWERQQRQSPGKQALPPLREIDFLLGVHDAYRVGALRFRLNDIGPFLDDRTNQAAPPFVRLRALQTASLALERDTTNTAEAADEWLRMLIAPGGSLGGARPKASVIDKDGNLWIAKFPSAADDLDVGGWELIVQTLARAFGLRIPESQVRRFASPHHCFMVRRFDRTDDGQRIHFASAMTLTGHRDGDDASTGVSYLELAQVLVAQGAQPATDLRELWCRIVFNLLVSNTDDHLRNHGFLLDTARGWRLSPAYDMNPVPDSTGLKLNISLYDNALDLDLALSVAKVFRVPLPDAREQIEKGRRIVRQWRVLAEKIGIPRAEQAFMAPAFRLADI
jgi:serine/threonine-protein kinase HipA